MLIAFISSVILLLILYPGIISTILHILTILAGVSVFYAIQRKNLNSTINSLFVNEKIFVLVLFLASVVCRIFFITIPKSNIDVINEIAAAEFILYNGIVAYFTYYSTLVHIGAQYPPLYPLLLAVIFPFGITLEYVKLFTVIVGSLIVIPTYLIGKELYDKRKATISALLIFSLPYTFLMSIQGLNDVLMTFLSALFMYFFILYIKNGKNSDGILSGTIIGVSLLFKYTIGIFYLSTLIFALFYRTKKEDNYLYKTLFVILVSLLCIIPWFIFMYYTGIIQRQIETLLALSSPGRKPGSDYGYEISEWFRFVSWSALFLSPTNNILLLIFISHLIYKGNVNWKNGLLLLWVIVPFIFFGVFHPLIRYWMISFPALTLLIANSIEELTSVKYCEKIFLTTFSFSLILCFLASYLVLVYVSPF